MSLVIAAAERILSIPPTENGGESYYIGNGITRFYEYGYTVLDDSEIIVRLDAAITQEYTAQDTGINFFVAPAVGVVISIHRITDVSQIADFEIFEDFDSEKTEDALDKLILLKQESLYRQSANLTMARDATHVEINLDAGTDAIVPLWNQDTDLAGVFAGLVTREAPADGAEHNQLDSFAWFQWDDNIAPPYVPESVLVNQNGGWAASQFGFYTTNNKIHPFSGLSLDSFTMSVICKCTAWPSATQDWGLFNILNQAAGTKIRIRRRSGSNQIFWSFSMVDKVTQQIANGTIEFSIDLQSTWGPNGYLDWMWLAASYNSNTGQIHFWIRNLAQGFEAGSTNALVINQLPLEWEVDSTNQAESVCVWSSASATGTIGANYWRGYISQTFMDEEYIDLSVSANRDLFCKNDGVNALVDGSEIFGSQPLVFLPNGLPSSNTGSLDLTVYPDNYYLSGVDVTDDQIPPVSATP